MANANQCNMRRYRKADEYARDNLACRLTAPVQIHAQREQQHCKVSEIHGQIGEEVLGVPRHERIPNHERPATNGQCVPNDIAIIRQHREKP